jgi:hypothetical protein
MCFEVKEVKTNVNTESSCLEGSKVVTKEIINHIVITESKSCYSIQCFCTEYLLHNIHTVKMHEANTKPFNSLKFRVYLNNIQFSYYLTENAQFSITKTV